MVNLTYAIDFWDIFPPSEIDAFCCFTASSGVATKLRRGQRAAWRRQRVGVVEFQKLAAIPRHLVVTRTTSPAAGEFKKA